MKKDKRINKELCYWDEKSNAWTPYTKEQLTVAYTAMVTAYEGKCKEIKDLKKEIAYRLNTIVGDYEEPD
jgi:hypothetical protein